MDITEPIYDLKKVMDHFAVEGAYKSGAPYGTGHINDTFLVETARNAAGTHTTPYILQRVNHQVFKEPEKLMGNVLRVTQHLRAKMADLGRDPDRNSLTLLPTKNGGHWHVDDDGNTWRLYIFISNSVGYDIVDSPFKAGEGGRAFGEFQKLLVDLPGDPLHETIPHFHDVARRIETFRDIVRSDPAGRAAAAAEEIAFAEARAEEMPALVRLQERGALPIRTTHNDTKFNNVLLDRDDGTAVCVIDLDTVMPGLVHYDYGDSIRTVTNTGAEDDPDLTNVEIDMDLFRAYTEGYLSEAHEFLTPEELEHLPFAGKLMPYMIGLRFLTDYIDGDNYFKVHRPDHNLERARAQFKLLSSMEQRFSEMQAVVAETHTRVSESG